QLLPFEFREATPVQAGCEARAIGIWRGMERQSGDHVMTPEQILADLASVESLPRTAMAEAGQRREEMIPSFLELIERLSVARIDTLNETDRDAAVYIYYLLGEWRDSRAFRPLATLLRQDPDMLELLFGDALTEGTARVITGVCDGDLQPIIAVIEDPSACPFVCSQMFDALVMIVRERPELRPEVTDFLERFPVSEGDKSEFLWGAWAFAIADLGIAHLEPQVRETFEQKRISPEEADFALFQKRLREAVEGGEAQLYQSSWNTPLIESAIDEMSGWFWYSNSSVVDRENQAAPDKVLHSASRGTFLRDTPKVGRNDPCPCGSGKKYKKCCLQA
ncbi:DUF1186 domain-containing protein, partial [Roseibium sp. RKSG952]|uniref:DUF1186 domain-containing protein n=1 Tax=Roseibium sp. RKSG952 TaxID=2529384 RepID=UPI0012BCFF28